MSDRASLPSAPTPSASRPRIWLMDEIRGFAVFCMVFYHAFYTLAFLFEVPIAMTLLRFFRPLEPFFGGAFIFISGICSQLSRSNLKRGIKLVPIAVAITLVTAWIAPDSIIIFGVIHFFAASMILFGLLKPLFDRIPTIWGLIGCVLLYLMTMSIQKGIFAFAVHLPASLYQTDWLCPFGIYSPTFVSADYFPLLPWLFVFLFGTFLGRFAAAGQFPKFTYQSRVPFFSWLGRHALIIYVVHQPIIYGIAELLSLILKK